MQIATTFFGVYLLTSPVQGGSDDASQDDEQTSEHESSPNARSVPTLALPAVDEHTPLLVPARSIRSSSPGRDASLSPNGILLPGSLGKVRLLKRTSTGDFGAALGIGSQAGLLLMAASPPPPSSSSGGGFGSGGPNSLRRGRSASRTRLKPDEGRRSTETDRVDLERL